MADQNATYATSPWSCVKDNVTGLIWEVKTDDGKLHDKDDGYTWHSTDNSTNGGFPGYKRPTLAIPGGLDNVCYDATITDEKKFCNTEAYVARVNTEGWCGSKNWRMPTRSELLSIAIYTDAQPSIDGSFFPNISQKLYWTSSSDDKGDVQTVSLFNVFFSSNLSKSSLGPSPNDGLPVMLVRSQ
ncbi:DUF1566 domain-containing protein [Thiothrix subterranea]|uniref:Lcl C-terminal domain-containing protein n=1 Tax=Thiothrix subterranea TaxID=2735563 RepID=UPI00192C90DC|nr:DUF1566 domain-containing protein [Thiothrix subterranea]QQZ28865.1 DUF1566 domain-containing protein [Thiothrix subterranea]